MTPRVALCCVLALSSLPSLAHARKPKAPSVDLATAEEPVPRAQWYYASNGQSVGPIDDAAFVDLYLRGRVTDTTAVWWEGAGDWVPLAQAPWFVELDRWYVRSNDKGLGPMTGAALRASLAKAQAQGKPITALEVRLEWSRWVPLAQAAPLNGSAAPVPWEPDPARLAAPAQTVAASTTSSEPPPLATTPPSEAPAPAPPREHERPITPAFDADAHADAMRLRKSGLITFAVGGSLVIIGGGIAGGYSTGVVGAKGLWTGVALASVGLLPTIIGGAIFGVGNRRAAKLQSLASLRVAPLAGRTHGGIAVGGRF